MKNFFNSFNNITATQMRAILMTLVSLALPAMAMFGMFDSYILKNVKSKQAVVAISRSSSIINDNADILTILSDASFRSYREKDITAGINPISLNRYFSTYANLLAKEEARRQLEIERARLEAEELARRKRPEDPLTTLNDLESDITNYENKVTYIYISSVSSNNMVMIDNKILKVGDVAPSGNKIKKIEKNRVLLEGTRGLQWAQLKF